jgi:hypothetical protein
MSSRAAGIRDSITFTLLLSSYKTAIFIVGSYMAQQWECWAIPLEVKPET